MAIVKYIIKYYKEILILIFSIIIGIFLCSTCSSARKTKNLEHNLKALTDSVREVTLKNGDLMYEKQLLILEKNELESYLEISKKEVKDLEKKLNSSLAYISKINGEIRYDTITCIDTIYRAPDGVLNVDFDYSDRWTNIKGTTVITDYSRAQTQITDLKVDVPLTLGVTDDFKIFAKSDNKNVSFSQINGAAIESKIKPKRWGMGPTVTVGLYGGYDFIHGAPSIGMGVMVGWSIHYNILQW